jgi:two-component system sensor histidine kinase DesK
MQRDRAMKFRLLPDNRHIGKAPYFFLLYLVFVFIVPFLRNRFFDWAVALASVVVFLPLYFRNFWVSGPEAVALTCGMALLGFVVYPFNSGATTYVIFAAAACAYAARPTRAAIGVVALVLILMLETVYLGMSYWGLMPGVVCLAVGLSNIHFAENLRHNLAMRRAQEQVEELAKVAERERIARDLHDLLGHTLSVIVMKSELASKLADRDVARAVQEIREVERVSRSALTEVRRAVEGYRRRGLAGEIDNAAAALRSAGVRFEAECLAVELAPRQETALALALREAVTNVVRHARASLCRVSLQIDDGNVVFMVWDNGRGGSPQEGNGLHGMRARVAEAGGTLLVDGSDGMRVVVRLPLKTAEAAWAS